MGEPVTIPLIVARYLTEGLVVKNRAAGTKNRAAGTSSSDVALAFLLMTTRQYP